MKPKDLTGKTFGNLTALRLYPVSDGHGRSWVCRCACGQEIAVRASYLTTGHTKSCGRGECRPNRKPLSDDELVARLRKYEEAKRDSAVKREVMGKSADMIERLSAELKLCRNELCLKCGEYKMRHKGACEGCRWLE